MTSLTRDDAVSCSEASPPRRPCSLTAEAAFAGICRRIAHRRPADSIPVIGHIDWRDSAAPAPAPTAAATAATSSPGHSDGGGGGGGAETHKKIPARRSRPGNAVTRACQPRNGVQMDGCRVPRVTRRSRDAAKKCGVCGLCVGRVLPIPQGTKVG